MDLGSLQKSIKQYAAPDRKHSLFQLLNSFLPYLALWGLMLFLMVNGYPYWITFLLVLITTIFQVRLFIIFHDCCHQSFYKSTRINRIIGTILGIITFTPYEAWSAEHLTHHATVANLDKRGVGDIWTMTVREYRAAGWMRRFTYRLVRNPLILFGLGPLWVFFIYHRLFPKGADRRVKQNVLLTNGAILLIAVVMSSFVGWKTYLLIQLPLIYISGSIGIWLFYIQHQFDPSHWAPQKEWDFLKASLHGSSYYRLPKVLQWMTGNIGLHHVHHINARIPNYFLQECLNHTELLQNVKPVTLLNSIKAINLNLWSEEEKKLVSFRSLRTLA